MCERVQRLRCIEGRRGVDDACPVAQSTEITHNHTKTMGGGLGSLFGNAGGAGEGGGANTWYKGTGMHTLSALV